MADRPPPPPPPEVSPEAVPDDEAVEVTTTDVTAPRVTAIDDAAIVDTRPRAIETTVTLPVTESTTTAPTTTVSGTTPPTTTAVVTTPVTTDLGAMTPTTTAPITETITEPITTAPITEPTTTAPETITTPTTTAPETTTTPTTTVPGTTPPATRALDTTPATTGLGTMPPTTTLPVTEPTTTAPETTTTPTTTAPETTTTPITTVPGTTPPATRALDTTPATTGLGTMLPTTTLPVTEPTTTVPESTTTPTTTAPGTTPPTTTDLDTTPATTDPNKTPTDVKTEPIDDDDEKADKILVAETYLTKTFDPLSTRLKAQRLRYNRPAKLEDFVYSVVQRVPEDQNLTTFKKLYADYLKRQGITYREGEQLTLIERLRLYWRTAGMTEDSSDIEYRLKVSFAELFTFLMFVIFLTTAVYLEVTPTPYKYHFTQSVRRSFFEHPFVSYDHKQIRFVDLSNPKNIWAYLTKQMVPVLNPSYYYNSDDMRIQPLFYFDNQPILENGLIGCPRVTLRRVKNDSCLVHYMFRRQFKRLCYGYFSSDEEDKSPLGSTIYWDWNSGAERDTASWGEFGYYPPGGFQQVLFWKSETDSRALLMVMKSDGWMTRATRTIIVDFLLFNPTVNYFCKVRTIVEFPPEGGINPIFHINTVKLIYPMTTRDFIGVALFLLVGVFGVYYAYEEGRQIFSYLTGYFKNFRHYIDLLIVIFTFYIFIYIMVKMFHIRDAVSTNIRNTRYRRHISLDTLVSFEVFYFRIVGLLLCLCFFKLFYFLHFTTAMSIINVTMLRTMVHVAGYMLFFGLVMTGYAFVATLLFGYKIYEFRTWMTSLFSLYRILLGDFNYVVFMVADRIIGPLFFLVYLFTVYFFLVNMFVAMVMETYTKTKLERNRFGIQHSLPFSKMILRGFWNTFGCIERPSYANREQKRAKQALMRVKEALLLSNFNLTEINMFFAKYGIDGRKQIVPADVHRILKDLERKGHVPMEPPTAEELQKSFQTSKVKEIFNDEILAATMNMQWTGLTLKDFKELMTRLRNIEKQLVKTSRRMAAIIEISEKFDKAFWSLGTGNGIDMYNLWLPGMAAKKKKRIETMNRLSKGGRNPKFKARK